MHLHPVKEGMTFNLPKIPFHLLNSAICYFYSYAQKYGHEARFQIFWDREKRTYFPHIPKFTSSAIRIETQRSVELELKHFFVVDLHSHLTATAGFSSTDDENELEDERIYGVIAVGRVFPDIAMRFCCGGNYVSVDPRQVFEMPHHGVACLGEV
jgi:hypothetical protein